MVPVFDVALDSRAHKAGIKKGDFLISINKHEINDVLDYNFYLASRKVMLLIHRGPDLINIKIEKDMYEDIGLAFESYLMDDKRSCTNKCIFCFIDQLPEGLRDTLYFKDDDSRMTFIAGNYITMTNLSEKDISRIINMKTSPINISVHTTNPELRIKMMKNRFAGTVLDTMRRFAASNIKMNCQIVLCKGLNDGDELSRTLYDLAELYPAVESISIVPAGITKFREKLELLEPYTSEECALIIRQVDEFASSSMDKYGSRLAYCGDELYIKSGDEIPPEENYEGYPQLENGVGMLASMKGEFEREIKHINDYDINKKRCVSVATGAAAYDFICKMVEKLTKLCYHFDCQVYKITNDFFGDNITVAGLITGADLVAQLAGKPLGTRLYLPVTMLRHEGDMFLDNMTPHEISRRLSVDIYFVETDGAEFVSALLS